MITYDLKFLTCDEGVIVKNTDFKTFKYETKNKTEETVYDAGKKSFCKSRNGFWRPPNSRSLKDLESKLRDGPVMFSEWMNEHLLVLVFSNGTIVYLTINTETLDVTHILFDRYCVGKLSGQIITGVVFTTSHILFTHIESVATLVTLGVSRSDSNKVPCKIADRNPHIQSIDLVDGARRADRHMSWVEDPRDSQGCRVLVWTSAGAEPAPWTPGAEIQANLHLYQISSHEISVIAYHQMENETLLAEISKENHNMIHIIEQVICQKSYVTLDWRRAVVAPHSRLAAYSRCSARLPASARRAAMHESVDRLLVACIDGTLHSIHAEAGLTHTTRADFIPSWLSCGGVALCADDARLQCYDRALSPLRAGATCLLMAHYFPQAPHMRVLCARGGGGGGGGAGAVLALLAGGVLAVLRVTHPDLTLGWLRAGRPGRAAALLRAMHWPREADAGLRALHAIFEWVWRRGLDAAGEALLQAALGSALGSTGSALGSSRTQVLDLARKFFHELLRRGRLDKALSLAVDVRAADLFADAAWAARRAGRPRLAAEARALLAASAMSGSECSESCSCLSSGSDTDSSARPEPPPPPPPPPPLPPPPSAPAAPALTPVQINALENLSTNSIRPNLHQYLERDLTLWTTDAHAAPRGSVPESSGHRQESSGHRQESSGHRQESSWMSALREDDHYQRELREASTAMYRHRGLVPAGPERRAPARPDKNVKFADTVSVAVLPGAGVQPSRELADSLPLCAPHAYLAAFEPQRDGTPTPDLVHV